MILKNARMILFDRIFKGDLRIEGSHISEIEENLMEKGEEEVLNLEGKLLIPGFIDVHIHGADGADAMDGSIESLQKIDRKSTRLNSSHANISYAVFCLKKK